MIANSELYKIASHKLIATLGLAPILFAQGFKKPGYDYSWIMFLIIGLVVGLLAILVKRKFID